MGGKKVKCGYSKGEQDDERFPYLFVRRQQRCRRGTRSLKVEAAEQKQKAEEGDFSHSAEAKTLHSAVGPQVLRL